MLFGGGVASAAAPAGPGVVAVPAVPIGSESPGPYELPADQPHGGARPLELPPAPPTFNVADRGWIHFAYPPSTRARVQRLMNDADEVRAELGRRLGQSVLRNVYVRIARTPFEMTTLAPEGAPYPKYASGVAYSEIGLVLLTLESGQANSLYDIGEVFRHELAHIALADAIGDAERVPHWFNEGLAVHLSGESSLLRLRTLTTSTLAGRLIPLSRIDHGFPADAAQAEIAYAESADVVRFLLRQEDRERFPALIGRLREGQPFASALRDAYGVDLWTLEHEWREDVAKRYSFLPVFFSGSLIWIGVLVLFALAWRRRRQKSKETLERWAREEAFVEIGRARATSTALVAAPRVHIVLPGNDAVATAVPDVPLLPPPASDVEVPKVEHDGSWHTLH
ncbi:MAG TPA: peptidase MA family metallohydrolase [Polyangiaceae bacterium]|nr:peptidase MA family metallohydrolase [Polyangiaceae bacterium]